MRRALWGLAGTMLAVGILNAPSAAASRPVGVVSWWTGTASPAMTSFTKAFSELNQGNARSGCTLFRSTATKALPEPYPPNAQIAYHWGLMLAYYQAGGDECLQGLAMSGKAALAERDMATQHLNDAAAQGRLVVAEMRAMLGG
ncbi:MAG TPA: hypothetical protein VK425_03075 [Acidimicrobiales bacterium]|nr:hypothetical protein [Acidimicrobiales bacterium]